MKCILCEKRKGKRFCPAKRSYICAQCCGEYRVIEIACPADCVYLKSGQSYVTAKKYIGQLSHEDDPVRRRRLYENSQKFGEVVSDMEEVIIRYAGRLRSFLDQNILEAVVLLKETYQTEEKGVIYEHTSSNPLVQTLLRDLRGFLEERRSGGSERSTALRTGDLVGCLEVMEADIRYHLDHWSDRENYLSFITRNHPKTASEAPSGGLIHP